MQILVDCSEQTGNSNMNMYRMVPGAISSAVDKNLLVCVCGEPFINYLFVSPTEYDRI